MKTTRICVRGASERVKLEGERGTLSLPESGNLTTVAREEKKEEGESEAHPYYMRVPHGRRAKSTSNPLTEINRKKARVIYRVTPPI